MGISSVRTAHETTSPELLKNFPSRVEGTATLSIVAEAIGKGDATVALIAAASILAKAARDRLMMELHQKYPVQGFSNHKGYRTARRIEALKHYRPCPVHRASPQPLRGLIENGQLPHAINDKETRFYSEPPVTDTATSSITDEMRTQTTTASPRRRQVAGCKPKPDAVSESSTPTRSKHHPKRRVSMGEATEKKNVQTGAYVEVKGDKATEDAAVGSSASSRRGNQTRKKAGLVGPSRRAMTNSSVKRGLRAPVKKPSSELVLKPGRKSAKNTRGGAQISERPRGSRVKKEPLEKAFGLPPETSKENKHQNTYRHGIIFARKKTESRSRVRPANNTEVPPDHVRTHRTSTLHSATKVEKDAATEETLAKTGMAGVEQDDVYSKYSRSRLKSSVRLSRRNAIFNPEEASKDARTAAARVRAAQEMSSRKGYERVLKPKGKRKRVPNKRP